MPIQFYPKPSSTISNFDGDFNFYVYPLTSNILYFPVKIYKNNLLNKLLTILFFIPDLCCIFLWILINISSILVILSFAIHFYISYLLKNINMLNEKVNV
jgi:hypothetical protein